MRIFLAIVLQLSLSTNLSAQENLNEYLVMHNIGSYEIYKGYQDRGMLIGSPEMKNMGNDIEGRYESYRAIYSIDEEHAVPKVEIQIHQNTQWLEHNLQREFRDTVDDETLGLRFPSAIVKKLVNSRLFNTRSGGGRYAWLHNNLWIEINYTDLQLVEPEPLEVVEAYLQKWPPTYPTEATKLIAGTEQWIKDEMEYLLWVSDRWFAQYDAGKETLKEAMWEVKDKLDDFLRYRAKYFDEDLDEERIAIKNANESTLRTKLKEYQQWLAENKDKSLSGL